jgi:hypothetical protein
MFTRILTIIVMIITMICGEVKDTPTQKNSERSYSVSVYSGHLLISNYDEQEDVTVTKVL